MTEFLRLDGLQRKKVHLAGGSRVWEVQDQTTAFDEGFMLYHNMEVRGKVGMY
jgi:hypothetical protein